MQRREFLRRLGLSSAGAAFILACGNDDDEEPASMATGTAPPAAATATPASATDSPRTESRGTLRLADNMMLTSVDGDLAPFQLSAYAVSESLMRITPELEIVPGLAESLTRVDATTWEVLLREGLTFHDGSPVDAAAVATSFERSFEKRPSTRNFIPDGSELVPNGLTLRINTPVPMALMPNFLAAPDLGIKKVSPSEEFFYTGPFRFKEFSERDSAILEAYPAYRGGPARLATVHIREVFDVNTRLAALQSGDVDMAQAMLPANVPVMQASGLQTHAFAFSRQNIIILNVQREPLTDVAVRRAIAMAVDRQALVEGVMEGMADAAYALGPAGVGIQGLVDTQGYDPTKAQAVLHAAGWLQGDDGVRARDGQRLAFSLGSYQQRAELEALSIGIQDQLRAVGMDVSLNRIADINSAVSSNDFDATMYSYSTIPYGEISRALESLYIPSGNNKDRYSNPRVNELHGQYVQESDAEKRRTIFEQLQVLIGEDVPIVYVLNPRQIVGTSSKVKNYVPHPIENYKLDADLAIET